MSFWIAVPPVLITIGLIYFTFYRILRALYRDHLEWFVGVLVFLAPFGYILSQATSLVSVMWILLLTPFYGIFVLLLSTTWVLQFYCVAFAALLIGSFLVRNLRAQHQAKSDTDFEGFLHRNLQGRLNFAQTKERNVDKLTRKAWAVAHGVGKCWGLILAVVLLFILSTTLVSA